MMAELNDEKLELITRPEPEDIGHKKKKRLTQKPLPSSPPSPVSVSITFYRNSMTILIIFGLRYIITNGTQNNTKNNNDNKLNA